MKKLLIPLIILLVGCQSIPEQKILLTKDHLTNYRWIVAIVYTQEIDTMPKGTVAQKLVFMELLFGDKCTVKVTDQYYINDKLYYEDSRSFDYEYIISNNFVLIDNSLMLFFNGEGLEYMLDSQIIVFKPVKKEYNFDEKSLGI